MKNNCTLIAVTDMKRSTAFYKTVPGLDVVSDFGANVTLTGGISLQTLESWLSFIGKDADEVTLRSNSGALYFEEDNIDSFVSRLAKLGDIKYVHSLPEHPWGQRVVRLYDPDGHIIEVGKSIDAVIMRFTNSGMTAQQTAKKMDVPLKYIKDVTERLSL